MCVCACVRAYSVYIHMYVCFYTGAHMNASISFTNCVLGRLPWRKLPAYIIGQFLGSFVAAALMFCMYYGMVAFPTLCNCWQWIS